MTHPLFNRAVALGAAALLALTACSSNAAGGSTDDSTPAGGTTTIRMAVTDLQGLEELQREFGAFEKTFEEKSGYGLEFFPVNDRTAAAVALDAGQLDLVFTGPAEYVAIHERTDATPVISINRPGYHSVVYTSADSGITKVEQLEGEKVAMSDIGSTSGHLGPSQLIADAGLDPLSDVDVLTVGDTVHEALLRGDVAAVGIGYHDYEEYTAEDPAAFPILIEGDDLPPDVIMASDELDPAIVEHIKQTFIDNWDELLAAMLEGKDNTKYTGATLVETTDADYDIVREMYRNIGVEDFANAPE